MGLFGYLPPLFSLSHTPFEASQLIPPIILFFDFPSFSVTDASFETKEKQASEFYLVPRSIQYLKLKDKMKRGLEDSNVKHKFHSLLEDFLELQKEHVSKKRKLRMAKQKRDLLMDEVRFLKERHEYLMNLRSIPLMQSNIEQEGREKEEHAWKTPTIEKKKPKSCLINENKGRRKKQIAQERTVHASLDGDT